MSLAWPPNDQLEPGPRRMPSNLMKRTSSYKIDDSYNL